MIDFTAVAAEIFLATAICIVILVDAFVSEHKRHITYLLSLAAVAGTAATTLIFAADGTVITAAGSFIADSAGSVLKMTTYVIVALVFLYSRDYLISSKLFKGEFFILGLFGLLGIMVMISAASLLTMYLGLELLSLSLYALVAFKRDSAVAAESAMKYFVLGAIASGTLLYGTSIIYGVTGTIEFRGVAEAAAGFETLNLPFTLGVVFIVVGIAFKFGAVPFHMWLPDVYEGSPTPVTLFIGSAPKIAAFALAWRVLAEGLAPVGVDWQAMLTILVVLSLAIGNVVAIAQTNFKRMLAYSTISHVGFILLGFIGADYGGVEAAMFYTVTYAIMAAGAFGIVLLLSRKGFESEQLEDLKGLNRRSPWFALMLLLVIFSMAGIPPLVGFHAKLAVLMSVIDAGMFWLAGYAVVMAVIGAYYYLRVIWYMYFAEGIDENPVEAAVDMRVALSINGLALVLVGIFPGGLLDLCVRVLN
ncbi:MAG: NADH-quinone oxidoreductase subunit NuoN [Gammaproteobacteria bacterium]|jgi:NADH-quinone oxidoreductase subunit N